MHLAEYVMYCDANNPRLLLPLYLVDFFRLPLERRLFRGRMCRFVSKTCTQTSAPLGFNMAALHCAGPLQFME